MKIVPFVDSNWVMDHPTGAIAFKHLLQGEDGSPDNFMYILGRQDRDYVMPIHRHNFDQIRLPIVGDMNLGRRGILREGHVGYFAEGLSYGPQEDTLGNTPPGERVQLVLQFGGASTFGFMSIQQRRVAIKELSALGRIEGRLYHHPTGKVEPVLNAVWKHVYGVKLRFPFPRYQNVVMANPAVFNWLWMRGAEGVDHKFLGSFSERGVWVEMVRVAPQASWLSVDRDARRLLFVLEGSGRVGGESIHRWTTIQVEAGEALSVQAGEALTFFLIGLPPIEFPVVASDQYEEDTESTPSLEPVSS